MKISAKLIPATFVKRDNRFRATVQVEGHLVWAHLPNSGRLRELLAHWSAGLKALAPLHPFVKGLSFYPKWA